MNSGTVNDIEAVVAENIEPVNNHPIGYRLRALIRESFVISVKHEVGASQPMT